MRGLRGGAKGMALRCRQLLTVGWLYGRYTDGYSSQNADRSPHPRFSETADRRRPVIILGKTTIIKLPARGLAWPGPRDAARGRFTITQKVIPGTAHCRQ